jgi:hypothetical protein
MDTVKQLKSTIAQQRASKKYYNTIKERKHQEYEMNRDEIIKRSTERYLRLKDNENFKKKKSEYACKYYQKKRLNNNNPPLDIV